MFQTLGIAFMALIISIIALVKSADILLNSASKLAKSFGISEFVIGLTIVSMGTSLPELATSIAASLAGDPGIIIGNIAGSNIANIGLILAIPLFFTRIRVKKREFDGMYMVLFSALLFVLFATDLTISGVEAAILLLVFYLYMNRIFKINRSFKEYRKNVMAAIKARRENGWFTSYGKKIRGVSKEKRERNLETVRALIALIVGIALLAISSKYIVISAVDISNMLMIPQATIAAILIAVGTSLPELLVSIRGISKGKKGLVFGNIIGSNIFNVLAIGGVAGLLGPIAVSSMALNFILPSMLFFSLALFVLLKRRMELRRGEGILLLALYAAFVALLLRISFA